MDILRFLVTLPVRLARAVLRLLGMILRPLFGKLAWSAPPWLGRARGELRRRPKQYLAALAGLTVLGVALAAGWQWYLHRPKPVEPHRITFVAHNPAQSEYEQADGSPKLTIHPLQVDFSGSAAPIELVGKAVSQGITMEPALKGEWRWVDDHTLRFTPAADWPVGAQLKVRFDKARAFAPHVQVVGNKFAVQVPLFAISADNGEFYQDPQNATAKKTIMGFAFNYPVDTARFEKRLTLALLGRDGKVAQPLKFTVTYDAGKLKAWVHSQPLDLPRDDSWVRLTLAAGVRSVRGGDGTPAALQSVVQVPGLYSLKVAKISSTLVDNDHYEPDQVLLTELSGAVRGTDESGLIQAWVLPQRGPSKPGNQDQEQNQADDTHPYDWNFSEVSDAVLRQSQPLQLDLVATEDDYAAVQSFKYHAKPGQRIYVRIKPGLKSFGGYLLGATEAQIVTVPDYPKLLRFMADGSLLSLSGSKRISVVSRNLPGMQLEIGRVLPGQLQHLVSFNQGDYAHPRFDDAFSEDHIVERFVQKRAFPNTAPGEAHYEGIDLGQYLSAGKHGVFLLHLSSYDPVAEKKKAQRAAQAKADGDDADSGDDARNNDSDDNNNDNPDQAAPGDTRMIVVTDLGMLVKRALDGSRDVFVQSIRTGQPVGGATVSVLALNGQTLFSQVTSADGAVHFPTFEGLAHEKRPTLYVVQQGDDLSFLPVGGQDRQLDYSRFDIGGEPNARSQGQLSAYLFSDRGMYRPGDLFHIGLVVRAADWTRSAAGIPLQAEIVDPRGVTVKQMPLAVDTSGFGELAYTPAETAPTGTWTVNLYLAKHRADDPPIGSTTVLVKEFLPDRMKVEATLSESVAQGWVKPDQLKGLVDAQNLFGTPAANRRVEATLTLRPAWPAFDGWRDYHFYDGRRAKEGYTTTLQDGHTDEHGHAEFDLDLKKYADATYQLYFLSKTHEADGGRSVAANAQVMVSSNDWLVGYKSVDNLDYVERDTPRKVHLVAINPQAKAMELKGLVAQLIEQRYVSVLTKQDSGVYKYESRLKEVPLSEAPLTIPAAGLDYTLPTDKPGNYALVIRRADRSEVNRVAYSVAGEANLTRSLDRNAELQINLSKHDYAPGETIDIAIRAPYAGSGLITIERDRVYAHAWFHAATSSSVQHITVPAGFEGNGYINVQYIRDPDSDEVFMSPLSYGVVPFSVNLTARRNLLKLDVPPLVKPGQTAIFKLHADHPTKAVLFAVDEGILQVAGYKLGDPLQYFFRKCMLQVNTSQILDLILPEFDRMMATAAPGGDADQAIGRQLNPFKRKRDKPVVYWSGIVDVDGDKDFTYTVPDSFNGRLRVMAVAVAPDVIGTVESATTVRGDFVLSPNVPTTLAPGDETQVSVGVANNLSGPATQAMPVSVTLASSPQLQVLGAATQALKLAPLHEGVAIFRVKATDTLGSGDLQFSAHYGSAAATQTETVSVRPAAAFRTELSVARVAPGSQAELPNLRHMYPQYARRDASMSNVPLVLAQGLTSWLTNTQNYCSEQLVSEAMPQLLVGNWPHVPALEHALQPSFGAPLASRDRALAQVLDALRGRQNSAGGFGLWTATPDSEPFVSAYVMNFLLEAQERGVTVPQDMLNAGNQYLQKLAGDESADTLELLRQRAYAVFLLTRQGNLTTNDLAAVQKRLQDAYPNAWKDDLAAAWLAASYKLLKQDDAADRLIAGPQRVLEQQAANGPYIYGYYDDPLTHDATVLYLLAKYFPQRAQALGPQAMENIAAPLEHNQFNTLSSAMTLLALDTYARTAQASLSQLAINEVHADGNSQSIATAQADLLLAGSWDAQAQHVQFVNHSQLPAWGLADQSGYDSTAPTQALKQGLEIVREYTDSDGHPVDHVKVGDELEVHLKIRSTADQSVGSVAIVDLLPGGFDPVLTQPTTVSNASDPGSDQDPAADGDNNNGDKNDSNNNAAAEPAWHSPIGMSDSTWLPEYADVREDRVVIYGTATPDVREFVYRIKATNAGTYQVPPAYGESMYDRQLQARAPGGAVLTVQPAS